MNYRRDTFELVFDILKVVKTTHKPTRIMYETNTSWSMLRDYINLLVMMGFIEKKDPPVGKGDAIMDKRSNAEYYLTRKGDRFVLKCKEVISVMNELRELKGVR